MDEWWRAAATATGFLLGVGAATWLVMLAATTLLIHRPPRLTPPRAAVRLGRSSPDDVGLHAWTDEVYRVPGRADGPADLPLRAWRIRPGRPARGRVVMTHGFGDSRAGLLAWAPVWVGLGLEAVLLDARGHGESGGRWCGGGSAEARDLHRVLDTLAAEPPLPTLLAGISFGAAVACRVAAARDDVAGLALDSPVADWWSATRAYIRYAGLPVVHDLGLRDVMATRGLGVDLTPVRTADALAKVSCPVLVVLPTHEPFLDPDQRRSLAEAAAEVWQPESSHNLALATHPQEYRSRIEALVTRALSPARSVAAEDADARHRQSVKRRPVGLGVDGQIRLA